MTVSWTEGQKQRLKELGVAIEELAGVFATTEERDNYYQTVEQGVVGRNREQLIKLKNSGARPVLCELETKLVQMLTKAGFVQVTTPIFLSRAMLARMTITEEHELNKQVFWIDENKCLRPMLAPNLYSLLKDLRRTWGLPVRIFEVGPCFRKESQGANHLNEFTMLNLVELGTPEGMQKERLQELSSLVMAAVGLEDYDIELTDSEVYGETMDITAGALELSSASYGPHHLDGHWGIFEPWVGFGLGLERVAMALEGHQNIRRAGRSLTYLHGCRLNL